MRRWISTAFHGAAIAFAGSASASTVFLETKGVNGPDERQSYIKANGALLQWDNNRPIALPYRGAFSSDQSYGCCSYLHDETYTDISIEYDQPFSIVEFDLSRSYSRYNQAPDYEGETFDARFGLELPVSAAFDLIRADGAVESLLVPVADLENLAILDIRKITMRFGTPSDIVYILSPRSGPFLETPRELVGPNERYCVEWCGGFEFAALTIETDGVAPIPLPSSIWLSAGGAATLAALGRRRRAGAQAGAGPTGSNSTQ